jgi:hypothetical protein
MINTENWLLLIVNIILLTEQKLEFTGHCLRYLLPWFTKVSAQSELTVESHTWHERQFITFKKKPKIKYNIKLKFMSIELATLCVCLSALPIKLDRIFKLFNQF